MRTGRLFSSIALAGATLLVGLMPILPARAQDGEVHGKIVIRTPDGVQEFDVDPSQLPPPGEGNLVVRIGPDGQVFTFGGSPDGLSAFMGPNGMAFLGGPGGPGALNIMNIIDPGRSYIHQLIKRNDVRSELLISAKQREALDSTDTQQQQAAQQQQQAVQSIQPPLGDLKDKSPDEIRAFIEEHAKQMREHMQSLADARDKRLASILTPKQMARLQELDLQWRGPLAMGVKPVADQVKLTNEEAPKASDLLKQYRQEVNRQLSFGVKTVAFGQKPGANAPASGEIQSPPATPAERQAKLEAAQKEIEKARKALGEKALKGITDEQRAQWSTLTD